MNKGQYILISNLMILLLYAFSYCSMKFYTENSMNYCYCSYYLKSEKGFEIEYGEDEDKVTVKHNKREELKNLNYKYLNKKMHNKPKLLKPNIKQFCVRRGM